MSSPILKWMPVWSWVPGALPSSLIPAVSIAQHQASPWAPFHSLSGGKHSHLILLLPLWSVLHSPIAGSCFLTSISSSCVLGLILHLLFFSCWSNVFPQCELCASQITSSSTFQSWLLSLALDPYFCLLDLSIWITYTFLKTQHIVFLFQSAIAIAFSFLVNDASPTQLPSWEAWSLPSSLGFFGSHPECHQSQRSVDYYST